MPASETSGPLTGPSSTTWRRQRLLRIGSLSTNIEGSLPLENDERLTQTPPRVRPTEPENEFTSLRAGNNSSYGTLPSRRLGRVLTTNSLNFLSRHGLPSLPNLRLSSNDSTSTPISPALHSPSIFRLRGTERPISAYDAPLVSKSDSGPNTAQDHGAHINGIRVWYSSFSSIDWLHDAIKDSVRFSRLRRRKSLRARIRLAIDKSIGWLIVTIVGFLTSVMAFLVLRSEQWLFDLKEGYCANNWWKAQRLCCPVYEGGVKLLHVSIEVETCDAWRPWGEILGLGSQKRAGFGVDNVVEYIAYAVIAVSTAIYHLRLPSHFSISSFWP